VTEPKEKYQPEYRKKGAFVPTIKARTCWPLGAKVGRPQNRHREKETKNTRRSCR